ncbi:PAS domain-containing protein [Acidobacteriia bacterium AH_259_A11_L15]|nr:PAS domain-containing protein [Acidobacteriia bacterium AH_259_A11_L15]
MSDGVSFHDLDYNILRTHQAFDKLFPDAKLGRTKGYKLVHGLDAPPDYCPVAKTMVSKKSETCEFAMRGRFLSVRTDPIPDAQGKVSRIIHIILDISECKRGEPAGNAPPVK